MRFARRQRVARMSKGPSGREILPLLVVFVTTMAVAPMARAQSAGGMDATHPTTSSSSSSTPSLGTPWGTRMEHWLVAGGALALGAITVAVGTGLQRYAVDLNHHALLATTTQQDAGSSRNTSNDFLLAAEVMWTVGASLAAIGLTWIIVLTFSTPAPAADPAPAAVAPTAALRVTPLGLTFEGVF